MDEAATAATLFDAPIASMQVQNDTANSDGDTDTDKLLLVALASGVTPDFPGVGKLPATLLTPYFTAAADFTGTTIRFSTSSTAPGFTLDAAPIQIVLTPNRAPTDIALSSLSVSENVPGADIGDVTVVDPDAGQTHSFTVSDNRFEIVDGKLRLQSGVSLDYEAAVTVPLDITATDSGTPAESYTESFVIDVQNANDRAVRDRHFQRHGQGESLRRRWESCRPPTRTPVRRMCSHWSIRTQCSRSSTAHCS